MLLLLHEERARVCLKNLFELTRKWNDISSIFTLACCAWALFCFNLAPRWNMSYSNLQEADDMYSTFRWSSTVSFTAAVLTAIDIVCLLKLDEHQATREDTEGLIDSALMFVTYLILGGVYFAMSISEVAFVHVDKLAYGSPRPVFTLRFIQWCCCVPLLMCVGGRQHKSEDVTETVDQLVQGVRGHGKPNVRTLSFWDKFVWEPLGAMTDSPLLASIRLTVIYIGSSWLAIVVDDHFARWLLICVSFSDYLIASLQEIVLLLMRKEEKLSNFASNLAALQVGIYANHGAIYLLAVLGLISWPFEQFLYGSVDVGAKLIHTIILGATRRYVQTKDKSCLISSAVTAAADVQRLIEDANVPIFSVNRNLEVKAWNKKITELTGRSSADARGRPLDALAMADGASATWNSSSRMLILDALEGKSSYTTQIRFKQDEVDISDQQSDSKSQKDEAIIAMAFSATPLRNAFGEITGAVCVGQDVTELTKQRREAQAIAAGLSKLIEDAAVPMFEVSLEMLIVDWNAWLANKTDKTKAEVLGTKLQTFLASECQAEVLEHLASEFRREGFERDCSDPFELAFEGFKLTLLMNAVPRTDSHGRTLSIICVGQDITKLKDIEEWKLSMMAMVSHELKSPLHGIIGLSHSLLEDRATPDSGRTALTMVNNSAKKLLDIVAGMMDTTSLLRARELVRAGPDPVSLVKIVDDVVLLNRQSVDKRGVPCLRPGVTLVNEVQGPLPMIEGDAFRITQLFFNLIANALKFTHQGSVTVSCVPDNMERKVTVYVKDTGVGVAPENLERIFQPFDQEDHSEQRAYEGLGLGLAVCREVVRRHGGKLTVRSKKGHGTTFRVQLPYKMRSQDDVLEADDGKVSDSDESEPELSLPALMPTVATSHDQSSLPSVTAQGILSGATIPEETSSSVILSVDDDLVNQQVLKSLLTSTSYVFKPATNGAEALNFIRENPLPSLVLMEVMMPGLSGISVLKSIRKSYSPEILPVIIVSARSNKQTIIDCLKAGANDFVEKPFEQAELLWRIKLQLKMSKANRYPKGKNQIFELFEGLMPQDLALSLQAATASNSPEVTKQAVRAKLERFLSGNCEKGAQETSPKSKISKEIKETKDADTVTLLKKQLLQAQDSAKKLEVRVAELESELKNTGSGRRKHDLSMQTIQQRVQMLENQVKERSKSLEKLKSLQLVRGEGRHEGLSGWSGWCVDSVDLSQMMEFEEAMLHKEIRVQRLTENLEPAGAISEIRMLVQELKDQVLKLYQESSQKDQLLFDANFKIHFLSMTLMQKDLQLGLCDSLALEGQADRPCS